MSKNDIPLDPLPIFEPKMKTGGRPSSEKAPTFRNTIQKKLGRIPRRSGKYGNNGGHPKRGRMASSAKIVGTNARRVIVKTRVIYTNKPTGKVATGLHLSYIERDGVGEDGRDPDLFSETSSNKNASEWEKFNTDWDTH